MLNTIFSHSSKATFLPVFFGNSVVWQQSYSWQLYQIHTSVSSTVSSEDIEYSPQSSTGDLKQTHTVTFNFLRTKTTRSKKAWLQIGGCSHNPLSSALDHSVYKIWREFLLLEYSKIDTEQVVISYLGLKSFILLKNVLIKKESKKKKKAYWKTKGTRVNQKATYLDPLQLTSCCRTRSPFLVTMGWAAVCFLLLSPWSSS